MAAEDQQGPCAGHASWVIQTWSRLNNTASSSRAWISSPTPERSTSTTWHLGMDRTLAIAIEQHNVGFEGVGIRDRCAPCLRGQELHYSREASKLRYSSDGVIDIKSIFGGMVGVRFPSLANPVVFLTLGTRIPTINPLNARVGLSLVRIARTLEGNDARQENMNKSYPAGRVP